MSWPAQTSFILTLAQMHPYRGHSWMSDLLGGGLGLAGLAYTGFLLWMIWHCWRTEPDRYFWLWLMIVVWGIGPLAYFVVRYLPATDYHGPTFLRRWTRGRELARLETAAVQIGNPYQYIQWADALRDVGMLDQAATAYSRALAKEPQNLPALWGAVQVASLQNRHEDVRQWTRQILDLDPQYKFGDVSLAHARSILELGDTASALEHLDQHVRRWRHPEAVYLLGNLHARQGNTQSAREHLQALIHDINGSPAAIARRYGRWKSRAKQMLKKLV